VRTRLPRNSERIFAMKKKGKVLVQVTSIILLVLGTIGLLLSLLMTAVLPLVGSDPDLVKIIRDSGFTSVSEFGFLYLTFGAYCLVSVIAAILGLLGCNRDKRFVLLVIAAAILVLSSLTGIVTSIIDSPILWGTGFPEFILVTLFVVGVVLRKAGVKEDANASATNLNAQQTYAQYPYQSTPPAPGGAIPMTYPTPVYAPVAVPVAAPAAVPVAAPVAAPTIAPEEAPVAAPSIAPEEMPDEPRNSTPTG
jgi:hypothetical protein